MALWLVRAGSKGEREDFALTNGIAVIGWDELSDLSDIKDRDELLRRLQLAFPERKPKTLLNWLSQLYPFISTINVGDRVALPLKFRATIAIGEVTGPYAYNSANPIDARHTRPVKWIGEIPRGAFNQKQLWSMGAFMTVCRLQKHGIEEAVLALLKGQLPAKESTVQLEVEPDDQEYTDFRALADEQIRQHISDNFKGHELERLVEAILQAKGYIVHRTQKGADGGVDLVAGTGALGFGQPRLVVQVKSEESAVDIKVLRELKGVMKDFGADHGLIVSWGGFRGAYDKEAMRQHFEVRLWTGDDLVRELQEVYSDLEESIRAELPLKRIWILAPGEV